MTKPDYPIEIEKYYQPMEDEEITILKQDRVIPVFLAGMLIFFLGIGVFLLVYVDSLFSRIAGGSVFSIVFSGFFIRIRKRRRAFKQDIANGYKIVYTGPVESTREESVSRESYYYVTVLGIEFNLPYTEWKSLQVGHMIEIHVSPKSKHIFQLTTLE